jgi:hypothetical protein
VALPRWTASGNPDFRHWGLGQRNASAAAWLLNEIGEDRVYATMPTAVEAYQEWCRAQPPSEDQPRAHQGHQYAPEPETSGDQGPPCEVLSAVENAGDATDIGPQGGAGRTPRDRDS